MTVGWAPAGGVRAGFPVEVTLELGLEGWTRFAAMDTREGLFHMRNNLCRGVDLRRKERG